MQISMLTAEVNKFETIAAKIIIIIGILKSFKILISTSNNLALMALTIHFNLNCSSE